MSIGNQLIECVVSCCRAWCAEEAEQGINQAVTGIANAAGVEMQTIQIQPGYIAAPEFDPSEDQAASSEPKKLTGKEKLEAMKKKREARQPLGFSSNMQARLDQAGGLLMQHKNAAIKGYEELEKDVAYLKNSIAEIEKKHACTASTYDHQMLKLTTAALALISALQELCDNIIESVQTHKREHSLDEDGDLDCILGQTEKQKKILAKQENRLENIKEYYED